MESPAMSYLKKWGEKSQPCWDFPCRVAHFEAVNAQAVVGQCLKAGVF